ncbi:3,4-dihydroxy-2-butanone-4-phosphate synthase [Rhodococcus qingshengii]|uniref:3,4-dihydroxy-2-butanone-4-phosphate synthase n=1 Tax=Rhodococcus qingshengii TaxID=334542 RepID=UPI0036DF28E1
MSEAINRVEQAVADLGCGKVVALVSDRNCDGDSYLVVAGEKSTTSTLDFIIRHTSGFVCAAVSDAVCAQIALPSMSGILTDGAADDYTVAVDAVDGVGTGISAKDRAITLRRIADLSSTPSTFTRPGHVLPMRARSGGILTRRRPAEAVIDLLRVASLHEVGALSALVSLSDPHAMADAAESRSFAHDHHLAWVSLSDIVAYRRTTKSQVHESFRTVHGAIEVVGYHSDVTDINYLAYRAGDPSSSKGPLVHVRFETGVIPHLPTEPNPTVNSFLASPDSLVIIGFGDPQDSHREEFDTDVEQILRAERISEPHLAKSDSRAAQASLSVC